MLLIRPRTPQPSAASMPLLRALKRTDADSRGDLARRAASIVPIIFVAPTKGAALAFTRRLDRELGERAEVRLGMPAEALPESAPSGLAFSAYASLPDAENEDAMTAVEKAAKTLGAHVDRDDSLELLVVSLDS
jgi:hypothetical protein